MTTPKAAVIGESLIDLIPAGSPTHLRAALGGSPYNVAIGLSRLGVDTALFARFGDTGFGRMLRRHALDEGLTLVPEGPVREQTTLAVVSLDENAVATYDFYIEGTSDWHWTEAEIDALPVPSGCLHWGSLASWIAPGDELIRSLARKLRATGDVILSYDPNVRPSLLGTPERGRELVEASVAYAHLLKASTEDLDWLYPGEAYAEVVRRWLASGPQLVVLTDGADGAHVYGPDGTSTTRPGIHVQVADTVGAGDSFTSALLAACLGHEIDSPQALASSSLDTFTGIVDEAIRASALTCTREGANPPTAAELAAAMSVD